MRVFAYNTLGFSALPGLPAGLAMAPITQPAAPALVSLQALDAAAQGLAPGLTPAPMILATITPPVDDGGAPVTAYKVTRASPHPTSVPTLPYPTLLTADR